ncbi:MAG: dihydrofolate reductase [Bacteroidales bacterium]|nr:dihydrofolate reductase [Bacteroidales bacterium]
MIDRFADIKILRYYADGFEALPLRKKLLLYHLSEAALWGRDIFWHQNSPLGLPLRHLLDAVYSHQKANGGVDKRLAEYAKRVWFANGPYHHYSNDKFSPDFSPLELKDWAAATGRDVADDLMMLMYNPDIAPKKVSLDADKDLVVSSAVNFYGEGVTQSEATSFYAGGKNHPLNSKLVKSADGALAEEVWRAADGPYAPALRKVADELRKASEYACNDAQAKAIDKLIEYVEDGDPAKFDDFNILWVKEKEADIDFINGFIEVYDDPLGLKGTWESIVELTDHEATKQIDLIAANAQWFEDHSPIAPEYRKKQVKGVSMNVISAVMLGGDCYPSTPIGVNLPNADWIRETHGSKSISLANITRAYHDEAERRDPSQPSVLTEFAASEAEIERSRRFSRAAGELHTQLHECLGHGSGQMREGVTLDDLKAYGSTIEEARADLFALYFMADPKMEEIGVVESREVAWAEYDSYLRSGALVQLSRIEEGRNIEEAHMRNRAIIARWVIEKGAKSGAVDPFTRNGKHYVVINDYDEVRNLFGQLLREVQRIKSEGDYEAAMRLVEDYGVKIDPTLHSEIRRRYAALDIPPFSGFVNPKLTLIANADGSPADVTISYDEQYDEQMLRYSRQYATL